MCKLSSLFHLHLLRGMKAFENEKYERAAIDLEKAIQCISANDPRMIVHVGEKLYECYRTTETFNKAERTVRRLLMVEPTSPEHYCKLSVVLNAQERFEEAEAAGRHAIQLGDQSCFGIHIELAKSLLAQNKIQEGHEALNWAIRLDVDSLDYVTEVLETSINKDTPEEKKK